MSGLVKNSKGLLTAVTVLTSGAVNILVALGIVDSASSESLIEIAATGITAMVTAIVSGIVLVKYIKEQTWLEYKTQKTTG